MNCGDLTPEALERIRAQLFDGIPEDPHEAHKWLMAKHWQQVEVSATAEIAMHKTDDPARREALEAHYVAAETIIALIGERSAEVLQEQTRAMSFALPDTREFLEQTTAAQVTDAQERRRGWVQRGRTLALQSRRRRRRPRPHLGARGVTRRPQPRIRRRSHIARSTSSSDPGDEDGPEEPPPPPPDDPQEGRP